MFAKRVFLAVLPLVLSLSPISVTHAADVVEYDSKGSIISKSSNKKEYLRIGGVANVRFVDGDHAIASASGTFASLTAVVTNRTPNRDGTTTVDMTHTFLTAEGGLIVTEDKILLIPVPGRDGVFSISVNYLIVSAAGGLQGYEGQRFKSQGFIDGNNSVASVRYDGEIVRERK